MLFPNQSYSKKALLAAIRHIETHAPARQCEAAKTSFVSVLDGEINARRFSFADFAKPLRSMGWSYEEAGLALIDYVVSRAKHFADLIPDGRAQLLQCVAQLEPIIDSTRVDIGARFTPENETTAR